MRLHSFALPSSDSSQAVMHEPEKETATFPASLQSANVEQLRGAAAAAPTVDEKSNEKPTIWMPAAESTNLVVHGNFSPRFLAKCSKRWKLKVLEAVYIRDRDPVINRQSEMRGTLQLCDGQKLAPRQ